MKKFVLLLLAFMFLSVAARSQGCVPIRSLAGFGQFALPQSGEEAPKWIVNVNSRYFTSFKMYSGKTYIPQEQEDQATNHIYTIDFAFFRQLDKGWSVGFDLPFTSASRTAWQEHDPYDNVTKTKHTTRAFGLGDIRVVVYKWLFDVTAYHKGNIQVGLGLKLPTGNYTNLDYFHKDHLDESKTVLAPVNNSIQLGDGGTGVSLELNGFYTINKMISLYGNAFYLSNPRDQNGTSTLVGNTTSMPGAVGLGVTNAIISGGNVASVADAYTVRAGANLTASQFVFWGGARIEGQPVHDIIGASNGTRRPGQIISLEPGVNYKLKKTILYLFVPVPVYRATFQSVPDKTLDAINPSIPHPSPGGFNDYMIFLGALFKI